MACARGQATATGEAIASASARAWCSALAAPAASRPYLDRSYPGWAERAVVQGSHLDPLDLAHSVIFRQEMRFDAVDAVKATM